MVINILDAMEANIFGTAAYLRNIHADLQRRWVTHGDKVEELWRSFKPSQREAVFLAGVKKGQVLKDPNDRSVFRSYALIPEMNMRDIAGSPDYFLDYFEFRAATGLTQQYRIGLEGAKGDHQVVMKSMVVNKIAFDRDFGNELTLFMDEEKYGNRYNAKSPEDYERVLNELASAVKAGVCVPRGVGELIIERQCYTIQHLCVLVDDILKLGSIIDASVNDYKTPEEAARVALSAYPNDVDPQPISVRDLVTLAFDRKTSFEAYWDLCRSNSAFLANGAHFWYSTRPDLVPDEKGRRMPLASDEYVSRAVFEVVHNAVVGIAIWDILCALTKNFLEALDEPEQAIILQEISNICHYEYDRIQKIFKRFVQVGIGSKNFKRLSNVFDNGTPRVMLKPISDRVMKQDPQLHYLLRLCQPVTGATQAVRWNNKLDQLHYNQPLEQDKLEEWEFNVLGEISLTINLVNTMIGSIQLPSASPKKGLTYVSKLKELNARLDPLKAHTNLQKLTLSLDDLKNPVMAKEALSIVDRFSEYYAGGPMVPLYQNLNKEFLEDLEIQLQETKGTQKTKPKRSSKKSMASRPATSSQQGQSVNAHSVSSQSLNSKMSRVLESFFETKSRVPAPFKPTEPPASEGPSTSAQPTELEASEQKPVEGLELSASAELPADIEKSTKATTTEDELFVGPDPYTQLVTSAMEAMAALNLTEAQPSDQPEIPVDTDTRLEPVTTGAESAIAPEENVEIGTAEAELPTEVEACEDLEEPGPDVYAESEMSASEDTKKSEPEQPDTAEENPPEVFKVSPSTVQVFSTIFSVLEEPESTSSSEPGPENSIKWLDFGAAMIDIGFSILPSVGSLYTFVPGEDSDIATFFTLHRPYLSAIWGDALLLLALRLKMLYGWGKETFVVE